MNKQVIFNKKTVNYLQFILLLIALSIIYKCKN